MAKGIENQSRSPPSVFDFATSQIQKHGGTKMYYDLVESGKRIKALRKKHGHFHAEAFMHTIDTR